jgi:hypothetical protein
MDALQEDLHGRTAYVRIYSVFSASVAVLSLSTHARLNYISHTLLGLSSKQSSQGVSPSKSCTLVHTTFPAYISLFIPRS